MPGDVHFCGFVPLYSLASLFVSVFFFEPSSIYIENWRVTRPDSVSSYSNKFCFKQLQKIGGWGLMMSESVFE